jgi:phosphatidylinositol glycan class U
MNPYTQGEILHHPPILLWFFSILKNSQITDNFNTNFFFSIIDLLICLQFIKINKLLNKKDGFTPFKIACLYMFNPFALLSTFSKSTYIINNLLIISTMSNIMEDKLELAIILLSFSTYLTYYSWYLLIPICMFAYKSYGLSKSFKLILFYISSLAILFGISYKLSDNSFNFINLCYLTIIKFQKITPNLGLWWYFFTEIFNFFRDFYLSVFNIYGFLFVIPLSMRFIIPKNQMNLLFVIWTIIGLTNFSKAYPVLTDYSLFYSTVVLFRQYYKYLKFTPIVSYLALFVVLLQSPTFYVVWMTLSSGNANFFYAIGLALSLLESIILSDFLWAFIQAEYYVLHPQADVNSQPCKLTQA